MRGTELPLYERIATVTTALCTRKRKRPIMMDCAELAPATPWGHSGRANPLAFEPQLSDDVSPVVSDSAFIKRDLAHTLASLEDVLLDWTVEESDLEGADLWDDPWEDEPSLQGALLAVERFVFWAAFAVRKLIESQKLSDEFEAEQFPVSLHPRIAAEAPEDLVSSHHLERFYDLAISHKKTLSAKRLCDQLIHSFQFLPVTDEEQRHLAGLLFNSDRTRTDGLFFIEWPEFERLIISAAEDDITYMHVDRSSGRVVKRREPPADRADG
jgi:hypothetical protein